MADAYPSQNWFCPSIHQGERIFETASGTSPAFEALLSQHYAAMSGTARALMALQMFETAQLIVLSSLPEGAGELDRKRELCRRFYGEELARRAYG